jgi:MFS superfamily sulfate permease-like transporter
MIMVAVGTFDWHSIHPRTLRRMPGSETTVMVSTVAVTVATHNLAIGVIVGVLIAMVLFARRVAHLVTVDSILDPDGTTKIYRVSGQLLFASSNDLVFQLDYAEDPENVIIDLTDAHIWDASTVASLDAITTKYATRGITVTITGMNHNSEQRHTALAGNLGGKALTRAAPLLASTRSAVGTAAATAPKRRTGRSAATPANTTSQAARASYPSRGRRRLHRCLPRAVVAQLAGRRGRSASDSRSQRANSTCPRPACGTA